MHEATTTIAGNVASDIRYAYPDGGVPFAGFRLASTPRRYDRASGAWVDLETMYYSVTCWRALAENVRDSLGKGDPVVVAGKLRVRSWTADGGRSGINQEINADLVGHDLNRGTAAFRKVVRARPVAAPEQAADADPVPEEVAA